MGSKKLNITVTRHPIYISRKTSVVNNSWGYMIYRYLNRLAEGNNFIRYFRCKIQDCLWERYVFACVIDAQQAQAI